MSFESARTDQAEQGRLDRAITYVRRNRSVYLMLAPAALFLLAVVGYPILKTMQLSFYYAPFGTPERFVGLQNYIGVFNDPLFGQILWQTFRWVVTAVVMKTLFGLLIALHLNHDISFRKFFRTVFLIPWGIPYAISAVVFKWMEHPQYGYINSILLQGGIIEEPIAILGHTSTAWIGAVAADIWIGTPFMAVVFLAGLQSIPQELYEAAAVDGASRMQQLRHVTLPQLRPVILIATLLSAIWTFVGFDVIWTMTQGGPIDSTTTLVIWIYRLGFNQSSIGVAAAVSTIGFLILLVFALIYIRIYTSGEGSEI